MGRPRWQCPRGMPLACAGLIATLLLVANASSKSQQVAKSDASTVQAEAYTEHVTAHDEDRTLVYGNVPSLRGHEALQRLVPASTYGAFVANMPIVCVDILLARADGKILLVKRHAEPVKGVWWWPGGRLLLGESFFEAAVRKVHAEIGIEVHACETPLFTANTLFEKSAWEGASTHTVNVLVHAVTHDPMAQSGLPICGDQAGRCAATGEHGLFKWIAPETDAGETKYVLDGLAALRARGGRCKPVVANIHDRHANRTLDDGQDDD